jgi:DNA polymerase
MPAHEQAEKGRPAREADATSFVPQRRTLISLRRAATSCRGCDLHTAATQTVFGEGPRDAAIVMVGEMPGDHEDQTGHVFVGPAGHELDRALAAVGIDRTEVYLTNVVKHFKFQQSGKRRIHQQPSRWEVRACAPWLSAELALLAPHVLVVLGAIAASALLGPDFNLTQARGVLVDSHLAPVVIATLHPAAILRSPDDPSRHEARREFTRDLQIAADHAAHRFAGAPPRVGHGDQRLPSSGYEAVDRD